MLVGQPYTQDHTAQQPVAAIAGSPDAHHNERQRRPEHDVEGGGFQDVARTDDGRHRGSRQGCKQLGVATATQLACQQPSDHDGGRHRQRCPDAQTGKRDSEQRQRHPGQQWHEDRLVDIPALQVPRGVEKVQLVAMKAVSPGKGHLEGEQPSRDEEHRSGGKPLDIQTR